MAKYYPVTMEHPKVKGTTQAASPSSEKVLKTNGWRPKTKTKTQTEPSKTDEQ